MYSICVVELLDARFNVKKDAQRNCYEFDHLVGDNYMYSIVKEIVLLQQKLRK